jgi:hypothetical protein
LISAAAVEVEEFRANNGAKYLGPPPPRGRVATMIDTNTLRITNAFSNPTATGG